MATERTGVLIIRAWIEPGSDEPLRAQIRLTRDVSSGAERTVTLADPEAVCDEVRQWLADMLDEAQRTD